MKTCTRCTLSKTPDQFGPGRGSDGLQTQCRACTSAENRRRYLARDERDKKRAAEGRAALDPAALKTCTSCNTPKPVSAFFKDNHTRDGFKPICQACAYAVNNVWRTKNPKYVRDANLKRYGITEDIYQAMSAAQGHKCRICHAPPSEVLHNRLHVDHNHETKTIRGLICDRCNLVLGNARDSIAVLKACIAYLEYFLANPTPPWNAPLAAWMEYLART